jgi:hypothetical protein
LLRWQYSPQISAFITTISAFIYYCSLCGSGIQAWLSWFPQLKVSHTVAVISRLAKRAGHWWLTPVILATQEADIRRIRV